MESWEDVLSLLDDFERLKPQNLPKGLEDYLAHVANTGDPVFQWSRIRSLIRYKLIAVLTEFFQTSTADLPHSHNVQKFDYNTTKAEILARFDSFTSAPFTIQRLCELLTTPRKHYNRVDKFMGAVEKNIFVVSTIEPRHLRRPNYAQPMLTIANGVMPEGSQLYAGNEQLSQGVCNSVQNWEPEVEMQWESVEDDTKDVSHVKGPSRDAVEDKLQAEMNTAISVQCKESMTCISINDSGMTGVGIADLKVKDDVVKSSDAIDRFLYILQEDQGFGSNIFPEENKNIPSDTGHVVVLPDVTPHANEVSSDSVNTSPSGRSDTAKEAAVK